MYSLFPNIRILDKNFVNRRYCSIKKSYIHIRMHINKRIYNCTIVTMPIIVGYSCCILSLIRVFFFFNIFLKKLILSIFQTFRILIFFLSLLIRFVRLHFQFFKMFLFLLSLFGLRFFLYENKI